MRLKTRLEHYRKMLDYYNRVVARGESWGVGLCMISDACGVSVYLPAKMKVRLPELYSQKPPMLHNSLYWWSREEIKLRQTAIKNSIHLCEIKIKKSIFNRFIRYISYKLNINKK